MQSISEYMTTEHRACDDVFSNIEESVAAKDWSQASERLVIFSKDLLLHLDKEEKVLFPAFEENTGMTGGPTAMMRNEHDQMRSLLSQLEQAIKDQNIADYSGSSETMHILMQQHNMKEEQMLYQMVNQHLSDQSETLIADMNKLV